MICLSFIWVRFSPFRRHLTQTNPKLMNKVIFRDPMEKSGEEIKETFFTIKNKKKIRDETSFG